MASSTPWFRYYSEALHDRKLIRAAEMAGVHILFMQGAWAGILSLASDSPIRGSLYVTFQKPFMKRDIADELHVSENECERLLDALIQYDMLDFENGIYIVKNWQNRQFDSDISTKRVQKYRTKMKNVPSGNVSETEYIQIHKNINIYSEPLSESGSTPAAPGEMGVEPDPGNNAHNHTVPPDPALFEKKPESIPTEAKKAGGKPKGSLADPRTTSPAVHAWKVVTRRNPPLALYDRVIKALGETPDLEKLGRVYEEWIGRGFKPTNIVGILKWYRDGIPAEPGQNNRAPGHPNGQGATRIVYDGAGNPVEVPL